MKISRSSIAGLQKRSANYVADWLVRGYINSTLKSATDPFYPHSFVNNFELVSQAIELLYASSPRGLQRHLRNAIYKLGVSIRPNCKEYSIEDFDRRSSLFKEFKRLSVNLSCFDAAPLFVDMATKDIKIWGEHLSVSEEVFPDCLHSVGLLAENCRNSYFFETKHKVLLERSLYRLVSSNHFKEPYAPFTLNALIEVAPEKLESHLTLLGKSVVKYHHDDPEQQNIAHKTAFRIVQLALSDLHDVFPKLSFRKDDSPDRWLLDALFSEQGPLLLQRFGPDPAKPRIFLKNSPMSDLSFPPHDDWVFYQPAASSSMLYSEVGEMKQELEEHKAQMHHFLH